MNKIKEFIKGEISDLKGELSLIEYISWWLIRAAQIFILLKLIITDRSNGNILLISINLLASFTIPLVRLLLFPKWLFKRLSFHAQTWLNVMIFFGSFLAQGLGWNHEVTSWDKVLHVMAGAVIVFIGDSVAGMFLNKGDRVSPLFRTYASVSFSYIAIVIWEVFEFFVDFYWPGSCNQAYNITPDRDPFFFMIFGQGAQNENQWAVFDTNVDMMCAMVGAMPAAIALFIYLNKKHKKKLLEEKTEQKETVEV